MRSKEKIGFIGAGEVGDATIERVKNDPRYEIGRVAVLDTKKHRRNRPDIEFTSEVKDILEDDSIGVVVEVMGGIQPATAYIFDAINSGKSVVTANKAALSRRLKDILDAARSREVGVRYDGSVAGEIDIFNALDENGPIVSVTGIVNGSTNFILGLMEEGKTYEEALAEAQELKYVEKDPTLDVEGLDASDKLAIIASHIFNAEITPNDIETIGITDITQMDIRFAGLLGTWKEGSKGYRLKLLAIARKQEGSVELQVGPVLLSKKHRLSSVNGVLNGVFIVPETGDPIFLEGRGAGGEATSIAVKRDIDRIVRSRRRDIVDEMPTLTEKVQIIDLGTKGSEWYMRTSLLDKSGSVESMGRIFRRRNLSVGDSLQFSDLSYEVDGEIYAPDLVTLHTATRGQVESAKKGMKRSHRYHGDPLTLPIEDL